jgi:hypothetical protein
MPRTAAPVFIALVAATLGADADAQVHCTGLNQWWDGSMCNPCSRAACNVGYFRASCTSASIADAACVPCTAPPANAVHVTGGLPHTTDNCLWACTDGYYRDGDHCVACTAEECPGNALVRQMCRKGSVRDAPCVCPPDTFMIADEAAPGGTSCSPCLYTTSCKEVDEDATLVKCPGGIVPLFTF